MCFHKADAVNHTKDIDCPIYDRRKICYVLHVMVTVHCYVFYLTCGSSSLLQVVEAASRKDADNGAAAASLKGTKRKSGGGGPQKKKRKHKPKGIIKPPGKVSTTPKKKATPRKTASVKNTADTGDVDTTQVLSPVLGVEGPAAPPPINAHRAKILVGKQALASIKEGTRERVLYGRPVLDHRCCSRRLFSCCRDSARKDALARVPVFVVPYWWFVEEKRPCAPVLFCCF